MPIRNPGRPRRTAEYSSVTLSLRFTETERENLGLHSEAQNKPIAALLREAAEVAGLLDPPKKSKR
jgi:hypothetical protein